jgi:hypothetical protein
MTHSPRNTLKTALLLIRDIRMSDGETGPVVEGYRLIDCVARVG